MKFSFHINFVHFLQIRPGDFSKTPGRNIVIGSVICIRIQGYP